MLYIHHIGFLLFTLLLFSAEVFFFRQHFADPTDRNAPISSSAQFFPLYFIFCSYTLFLFTFINEYFVACHGYIDRVERNFPSNFTPCPQKFGIFPFNQSSIDTIKNESIRTFSCNLCVCVRNLKLVRFFLFCLIEICTVHTLP